MTSSIINSNMNLIKKNSLTKNLSIYKFDQIQIPISFYKKISLKNKLNIYELFQNKKKTNKPINLNNFSFPKQLVVAPIKLYKNNSPVKNTTPNNNNLKLTSLKNKILSNSRAEKKIFNNLNFDIFKNINIRNKRNNMSQKKFCTNYNKNKGNKNNNFKKDFSNNKKKENSYMNIKNYNIASNKSKLTRNNYSNYSYILTTQGGGKSNDFGGRQLTSSYSKIFNSNYSSNINNNCNKQILNTTTENGIRQLTCCNNINKNNNITKIKSSNQTTRKIKKTKSNSVYIIKNIKDLIIGSSNLVSTNKNKKSSVNIKNLNNKKLLNKNCSSRNNHNNFFSNHSQKDKMKFNHSLKNIVPFSLLNNRKKVSNKKQNLSNRYIITESKENNIEENKEGFSDISLSKESFFCKRYKTQICNTDINNNINDVDSPEEYHFIINNIIQSNKRTKKNNCFI